MKATDFEYRHQTLLHMLVIGLSLLTYLRDRVDIVWGAIRNHPDSAWWEHLVFGIGAFILLGSAILETWANASDGGAHRSSPRADSTTHSQSLLRLARILLVLCVGLLLPVSGTVILLICESILILRLFLRDHQKSASQRVFFGAAGGSWRRAFRAAASKWGLAATMIAFAWTLQDRIAEIGAACSLALWLVLNVPNRLRSRFSG